MNFFKKISPKVVASLIIVYLSFILIGCPFTIIEIDEALIDFNATSNTYEELNSMMTNISELLLKNAVKIHTIAVDLSKLTLKEKEQMEKLSKEALDILTEQEELFDELRDTEYNRNNIIPELQENVTKIKDPSIKLLAQEIVDKLIEINSLETEQLKLLSKKTESDYLFFNDILFVLQGKMTMEEADKRIEERGEELKEIDKRYDEISNAINPLIEELKYLEEKLESLTMSK